MLNSDVDEHIFHLFPIFNKRSFLRTCKNINQLSIDVPQIETDFQKMLNDTGLYISLHKYSMELLYDGY